MGWKPQANHPLANPLVTPKGQTLQRIAGSRQGPLIIAACYVTLFGAATFISAQLSGVHWEHLAIYTLLFIWVIRAYTLGVFISETSVKIRGWFRTFELPHDSISAIGIRGYSGLMNRFTQGSLDPLHLFVYMLVIEKADGREIELPSTASSRRQARAAIRAIHDCFPTIRVRASDLDQTSRPGRHTQ